MRAYVVAAAVFLVSVVGTFVFWRARAKSLAEERNTTTCRLERGAVFAFVGLGDGFATAVVDVARPDARCVDRRVPRESKNVGVRGSDGALVYLKGGRIFEARPEKGVYSALRHATTYPREPPPDPEIEAPRCSGKIDGFLASPDDERLVYWCGNGMFHGTDGKDLALDPKTERPLAIGHRGRVLGVRDRGGVAPGLFVLGPLGQKVSVADVEVRFARASLPVRAVEDGFLVLLPRGLAHAHDMFHVDFEGHARRDQRYEDLPEAEVGTFAMVIGDDASLYVRAQVTTGEEAVVRLPPKNAPVQILFKPGAELRFASADLFAAP